MTKHLSALGIFLAALSGTLPIFNAVPSAVAYPHNITPRDTADDWLAELHSAAMINATFHENRDHSGSRFSAVSMAELPELNQKIRRTFQLLFPDYVEGHVERSCAMVRNSSLLATDSSIIFYSPTDPDTVIEIVLLADANPNAFVLPAEEELDQPARIALSMGLLETLTSESELAFVLAHEAVHITERHFAPNISGFLLTPDQMATIAEVERGWEYEADLQAHATLTRAGYDIQAGATLLQNLASYEAESEGSPHRHHPAIWARVTALTPYS